MPSRHINLTFTPQQAFLTFLCSQRSPDFGVLCAPKFFPLPQPALIQIHNEQVGPPFLSSLCLEFQFSREATIKEILSNTFEIVISKIRINVILYCYTVTFFLNKTNLKLQKICIFIAFHRHSISTVNFYYRLN